MFRTADAKGGFLGGRSAAGMRQFATLKARLWRRFARGRGDQAASRRHRQGAEHHPHRTVQGAQRPPRHAVAEDAGSAAAMAEGAANALRYGRSAGTTLVVPWRQVRQADVHPAAQSSVSQDCRSRRYQEGGDAACVATQFRDPSARTRDRYSSYSSGPSPRNAGGSSWRSRKTKAFREPRAATGGRASTRC